MSLGSKLVVENDSPWRGGYTVEVLIFYFQSYYAFFSKKATVKKIALKNPKMLQKQNCEQKSSCDIFKSMLDRNVRFFGGRNTSNGLTLKRLPDPQPTQRRKPPTVVYFGVFWAIFTYSLS